MTGFSPALLRAWERRHGLLQPKRTEGGHRLYTSDDLRVLQRIRQLLDEGRTIGEVAAAGRASLLATAPLAVGATRPAPVRSPAPPPPQDEADPLGGCVEELVDGAVRLDAAAVESALDRAFSLVSPEGAIAGVVEPAMRELGELWAAGELSVAGEHLASGVVAARLTNLLAAANPLPHPGVRRALVACFPEEQHQLGALLVGYALARRGYRVSWLGASLPFEDLEHACQQLRPDEVHLSVSREATLLAHRERLQQVLERLGRSVRFTIGGAGVTRPLPDLEATGARVLPWGSSFSELLTHPTGETGQRR